ncbi:MAG: hypothetical protein LBQ91_05535 [Oscillospiraceae bacterium]|jgi:hypothetical protein|nr:hypothetical protein [Oscillospiraceae bacterium]
MELINEFDIKMIQETESNVYFDFFIDDSQLSKILGFSRLEDLGFCYFDLDKSVFDKEKFPKYNQNEIIKHSINGFLGIEKTSNQFGTGRAVLYRCHCGCDYCGVISCEINIDEKFVSWKDIRYEDTFNREHEYIKSIKLLKFKTEDYFSAFDRYKKRYIEE